MAKVVERAPAKLNLTLEVLGRRPDGYHELESLVAFASVGDQISLDPSAPSGVSVTGTFAGSITGPNILDRALALLHERAPALKLGAVHLQKEIPVAAGLGGGSADAAALLRALRAANPNAAADVDWLALAVNLGADVAVCFEGRASWIGGIGDKLAPLADRLPPLFAVVANPLAEVPADKTARVFRELRAPPLRAGVLKERPAIMDRTTLLTIMRERGNHLSAVAQMVVPEMRTVLEALKNEPGADIAAVSGAGPSCFALFENEAAGTRAAARLKAAHPGWWIVTAVIS